MALNVNEWTERLDPERRRQVEERAAELIAEEMTLRELRKGGYLGQRHAPKLLRQSATDGGGVEER